MADSPLDAWQRRLVGLVVGGAAHLGAPGVVVPLSQAEQRWFEQLAHSSGLHLTRHIQRSWCLARAASVASLTLSVIENPHAILEAWAATGGGRAAFAEREAVALLDFIAQRLDPNSHASSMCAFERAVRLAQAGEHCSTVRFRAAPQAVLQAAAERSPMPAYEAHPHWLVIASHLPGLWRHATEREACSFEAGLG